MVNVLWNGPDPVDRDVCPYSVDFICKPAPAGPINSLDSGRLVLAVRLKGDSRAKVKEVAVRLVNNAKSMIHDKVERSTRSTRTRLVSVPLERDAGRPNRWTGVLRIPVTWVEGGTKTYERTGSWTPRSKGNLFSLEITYRVLDGSNCTARFQSADAFHWTPGGGQST